MLLKGCVNTVAFILGLLTDESPRPPRCNYSLQAQLMQRDAKRQLIRSAQDRDLYRIKAEWLWPEVHTQLFTAAQCMVTQPCCLLSISRCSAYTEDTREVSKLCQSEGHASCSNIMFASSSHSKLCLHLLCPMG